MALSTSPRKVVPLTGGDNWESRPAAPPLVTKRVFFCGVVVESSGHGRGYSQDVKDLVSSLGEPLRTADLTAAASDAAFDAESVYGPQTPHSRKRAMTDSSALSSVITELVKTERSYVERLRMLKYDYADPLRNFARNKDTAIIPPYEAKILFGNVDNLIPVNEAFLADLERMLKPDGASTVGGVGDIALRHFRDLPGFDLYKTYYSKREEAQAIYEREKAKKSSGFADFIDRIKYSGTDVTNRVGLGDLLMDPVQRIPRYTLMFRAMTKHMAPGDPQRALLEQADEIASKIARAEMDDHTKRAAIIHTLCATVENFPPALISNKRLFIDCIDVEDHVPESHLVYGGGAGGPNVPLHCSLFLFDDKLMIVKRPGNGERSGRALSGLDELEKMAKTGGLPLSMKKSGMVCKGVIEVTDIVATDAGQSLIHLYLEHAPQDEGERWSGRPFRSLTVALPPSPATLAPTKTESAKTRFLEHLWEAQAQYRTKQGQSVILRADDYEVESRRNKTTLARTYFNVYQRTAFLKEPKKTKIVLHIDELGSSDPLPFGLSAPPHVIVRVQPMAGDLSRYTVCSSDPADEGEEDIVQTNRVPTRIVQTIHQYGLFKFKTDAADSRPATPSATTRSRGIFNLDSISKNIFAAMPGSSKGDIFSGSIAGHKRVKSTTSRSSASTATASTGDGSLTKWSSRMSSSTAATSVVSTHTADDDYVSVASPSKPRSLSRGRRLIRRGKSPSKDSMGIERVSSRQSSHASDGETVFTDDDDDDDTDGRSGQPSSSAHSLANQLKLARQNSENQFASSSPSPLAASPLYEDAPDFTRPLSRASKEAPSHRSVTPRPHSPAPVRASSSLGHSLSTSLPDTSRPMGPRSPSPLPSSRTSAPTLPPLALASDTRRSVSPDMFNTAKDLPPPPSTPPRIHSPIPRSRPITFPSNGLDATPRASRTAKSASTSVQPLSIQKKPSVKSTQSPGSARKVYGKNSVLSRELADVENSPSRKPAAVSAARSIAPLRMAEARDESADRLVPLAEKGKQSVDASYRAVKRIKIEAEKLRLAAEPPEEARPASPTKPTRIPGRAKPPVTKEAQSRYDELMRMVALRGENIHHSRQRSLPEPARSSSPATPPADGAALDKLEDAVTEAERDLLSATATQDLLLAEVRKVAAQIELKSAELERTQQELKNSKRQCDLVKDLLSDSTAEKEIMYEAFNEELDGMFNDVTLPEDEAWDAMTADLRQTKLQKNELHKENSALKRKLAEYESQMDEWEDLLRSHSLIA